MRTIKRQRKTIIGLTGGIASGKTTIAYLLKQLGARVISCDELAHAALKKNTVTYRTIVKAFGKRVLDTSGSLSRKKLGTIVFSNAKKREALESIIHPYVFQRLFSCIKKAQGVLVIDIPLLFETGFQAYVDRTIVVSCSVSEQVRRLMMRDGLTQHEARQRINAQMPLTKKRKMADWVITNSSVQNAMKETKKVWDQVQKIMK